MKSVLQINNHRRIRYMKKNVRIILKAMLSVFVIVLLLPITGKTVEAVEKSDTISIATSTTFGQFFKVEGDFHGGEYQAMFVDNDHPMTISAIEVRSMFYRYGYSGSEQTWVLSDSGTLPLRFVRYQFMVSENPDMVRNLLEDFIANGRLAYVDGNLLSEGQYVPSTGSLIISLKDSYLNTLSVGKHTLTVKFTDGTVSADFYVKERVKPSTPDYVLPRTGE